MVTVGNPGNAGESSGNGGSFGPIAIVGAVNYAYQIGKYEVTAGQYTEFLNAVAKTDTYGLYNVNMWSNTYGSKIQRTGSSGSYTYSVAADRANRPVNYVSWGDAARFANWLSNDQLTGSQGLSTTEDGSYYLNGATSEAVLMAVTRKASAKYSIPSENEWYKAAYHRNDGVTANYWDYPTGTNSAPIAQPPPGGGNSVNIGWVVGKTTDVGAYSGSHSSYGTFDQGGNVWEWNEWIRASSMRGLRGGAFDGDSTSASLASNRNGGNYPTYAGEGNNIGFRVASSVTVQPRQYIPDNDITKNVPLVDRLGKWNETTKSFDTVSANSVGPGKIHVLVHGWGNGLKSDKDKNIWDVDTYSTGQTWKDLARSIAHKDPGSTVLMFNWLDMSATPSGIGFASKSRDNTDLAATLLWNSLLSACSHLHDPQNQIQLYGHSHGARVATEAAYQLSKANAPVRHITIADSPDGIRSHLAINVWNGNADNQLQSSLAKIKADITSGKTFIENYCSEFGLPYFGKLLGPLHDVTNGYVEVQLDPNNGWGANHAYPNVWYTKANNQSTELGLEWSPLLGSTYFTLDKFYEQDWRDPLTGVIYPDRELVLKSASGTIGGSDWNTYRSMYLTGTSKDGNVQSYLNGNLYTEDSPAFQDGIFTVNEGDNAIAFNYQFLNQGDGDEIGIWIDGELRFRQVGELIGSDIESTTIGISGLEPGEHAITIALHNYGEQNASVYVGDFQLISVPEPRTLSLLALAALCLAGYARRPKRA
jgi:formylglycine-generating enzyme required for sulfatase activity